MKVEFTKCWSCPRALPGQGVSLLHRCPSTRSVRVPLPKSHSEPPSGRQLRTLRLSSSCWNAGAGSDEVSSVREILMDFGGWIAEYTQYLKTHGYTARARSIRLKHLRALQRFVICRAMNSLGEFQPN